VIQLENLNFTAGATAGLPYPQRAAKKSGAIAHQQTVPTESEYRILSSKQYNPRLAVNSRYQICFAEQYIYKVICQAFKFLPKKTQFLLILLNQ
jgi:hypothetical protein